VGGVTLTLTADPVVATVVPAAACGSSRTHTTDAVSVPVPGVIVNAPCVPAAPFQVPSFLYNDDVIAGVAGFVVSTVKSMYVLDHALLVRDPSLPQTRST
jgi:hypothetical protein